MTYEEKLKQALEYLGNKWVLACPSTYEAKLRQPGICTTLRPVIAKAVKEGRL